MPFGTPYGILYLYTGCHRYGVIHGMSHRSPCIYPPDPVSDGPKGVSDPLDRLIPGIPWIPWFLVARVRDTRRSL